MECIKEDSPIELGEKNVSRLLYVILILACVIVGSTVMIIENIQDDSLNPIRYAGFG